MKKMKMKSRFKYTIHNLIGHPLMEILHLMGLQVLSEWAHDATLPSDIGNESIEDAGEPDSRV